MRNMGKMRLTRRQTEKKRKILKVSLASQTHVYYDKNATERKFPKMVSLSSPYHIDTERKFPQLVQRPFPIKF